MAATSDSIRVSCPGCAGRIRVPQKAVGKRVKCPKCEHAFRVEAPSGAADGLDALGQAAEPIRFPCDDCGQKLKAPAGSAGKRVKCRHCGAVTKVPSPDAPAESDDPFGGGLLDDLAASESGAAAALDGKRPCPSCNAEVAADAVVCTTCGFNFRTGGRAAAPTIETASDSGGGGGLGSLSLGMSLTFPSFTFGILFSCIGALIGGAIWFAVAYYTMYEIGWIACGVGALAGGGMAVGFQREAETAGLVAGAIACVGIIAAKMTLFGVIFWWPVFGGMQSQLADVVDEAMTPREELVSLLASDLVDTDASTLTDSASFEDWSDEWDAQYAKAEAEAARRVEAMTDAQVSHELLLQQETQKVLDEREVWAQLERIDDETEHNRRYKVMYASAREKAEEVVATLTPAEIENRLANGRREELAAARATTIVFERGQGDDIDDFDAEYEPVYQEELAKVQNMSPDEVDRALPEARRAQAQALTSLINSQYYTIFFVSSFGLFDILFFTLALLTAWKIGRTGGG